MPRGRVPRVYYIKSIRFYLSYTHHKTHTKQGVEVFFSLQPLFLESLQALICIKVQVANLSVGMWSLATAGSISDLILLFCRSKDAISSHLLPHLTFHHYPPLPLFVTFFEAQNSSYTMVKWGTLSPKK